MTETLPIPPLADTCCFLACPAQESKYPHQDQGGHFLGSMSHFHPGPQSTATSVLFKDMSRHSSGNPEVETEKDLFVSIIYWGVLSEEGT